MINNNSIDQLIRPAQAAKMLGISKHTLYRGVKSGRYPKQVKIGVRSSGWKLSELQAFIENLR